MKSRIRSTVLPLCLAISGYFFVQPLSAQTLSNTFTGVLSLDGDISDFFEADGVTPRPGVCVKEDPTPLLLEAPVSGLVTKSGQNHPSGFNQRRIMTAYHRTLNGGTVFVGVDLPGGTGSAANPNYAGPDGPTRPGPGALIAIRPFDADGNGEPEGVGYDGAIQLQRCTDLGATLLTVDVIDCSLPLAGGFTDAVDFNADPGNKERYSVTINFGDGTQVQIELFEDNLTATGQAGLNVFAAPGKTFGAMANRDGANRPLGFDVEFAITNINANVGECARLVQNISVNSGSLQDGSPNGEDFNNLRCAYILPAGLELTKVCPPNPPLPGQLLVFTGTLQNTGLVTLTNVFVVNNQPVPNTPVIGPVVLAPGQLIGFTGSYLVPANYTNCSIADTLTATGVDFCSNRVVNAMASAVCPVRHILILTCPTNVTVQCLSDVPPPNFAGGIATSTAGGVVVMHVGDVVTNVAANCAYVIARTYKATDGCTNMATCTQTIIVRDTIPPIITCPQNLTVQCLRDVPPCPGSLAAFLALGGAASDNCDTNLSYFCSDGPLIGGICGGTIARTHTVVDDCTNAASCVQIIRVNDTIPPIITCPTNLTVQCLRDVPQCPGSLAAFLALGGAASDNCDTNLSYFCSDGPLIGGICGGTIARTHTVVDDCTNAASCVQIIRVNDTIPPIITCPTNLTVPCLRDVPPCPGSLAAFLALGGTASDNCDTNLSYFCSDGPLIGGICGGTIARTHTVVDDCTNAASCVQIIRVNDTLPPVITCPPILTVQCLGNVPPCPGTLAAFLASGGQAGDNCDTNLAYSCSDGPLINGICGGTITRTHTVIDDCTNAASCVQLIVVRDTIPPIIACPTNLAVQCLQDVPLCPGSLAAFLALGGAATDNCDTNLTYFCNDGPLIGGICGGTIVRTHTVVDDCTNSASCVQILRILDTIPPVIACPPDRIIECVVGGVPVFGDPTVSDTCDTNVTVTFVDTTLPATCPAVRIFRRTWTATDDCTNRASCSQTITFVDTTPPLITCQPDRIIECVVGGVPVFGDPTVSDTCDTNVTVTFVDTALPATCPAVRIFRRTWTATDDCTNRASCSQTITFVDTTPPLITCQPDRILECVVGGVPVFGDPTVSDTCDTNVTVTFVDTSLPATCPAVRIFRRTWTATDDCTNRASCSQTITFVDTTPPVLVGVPSGTNVQCLAQLPPLPTVTASDACDTNVTVTRVSITNGACPMIIVHIWTATDDCTNSASASRTNVVFDTIPPVLVGVPGNTNFQCLSDVPPPANVTATDNCDGSLPVTTTYVTNGACPTIITCTWRAQDRCTNSASATRTITVRDTIPPVLVGVPSGATYRCANEVPPLPPVTATDNCDGTNVLVTRTITTNGFRPTTIVICWTATDRCTNSVTACRTNVVLDLPAVLGDFVWHDLDGDGIQDAGEPGIPNATVKLQDAGGVTLATTTTDGNGLYLFPGLTPGTYKVMFVQPAGYVRVSPLDRGADDARDSDANPAAMLMTPVVTLLCGETNTTLDAGFFNPAALGDFVWFDINHDGIQQMGEPGVSNVTVQLMDCAGNVLAVTTTDVNGFYLFTGLVPGDYKVTFILPSGFSFTLPNQGGDDALDSDADPLTGMSQCVHLMSGETNRTVDAGLFLEPCIDIEKYAKRIAPQFEGLTPGFWKNHSRFGPAPHAGWPATGYDPLDSYEAIFGVDVPGAPTLLDALNAGGGGVYALMRHSTAALLNSAHSNINYAFNTGQVISLTRDAINSGDAGLIEFTKNNFARENERGANLNNGAGSGTSMPGLGEDADTPPGVQFNPGEAAMFSFVVTNCGDLELTNVVVVDNNATSDPADDFEPSPVLNGTLNAGDTDMDHRLDLNERWLYTYGTTVVPGEYCNLATVTAAPIAPNGQPLPGTVTDSDTACWFTPFSCTNRLTVTLQCTNATAPGQPITFSGQVRNSGTTTITNVTVTSSQAGLLLTVPSLGAGQQVAFSGSYTPSECGPSFANTVTATGRSACDMAAVTASVTRDCGVPCPTAHGCRVTGGSNRETNMWQAPCITTPLPSHVSHGGQVGAPFSVGTPFTPNSPCISGEWQHNRHTRNGNHLVGNFHASGNGHERQFDSLLCACLPCPENPNAVGVVGEICNPGDRICGPEPRRAPANKICFSGVGDYTFTEGRRTVKAVFRVDIEDRSEGNSHASSRPPDRYRIRLWILDPNCGRNPDPNSAEAMALRIAASADPAQIGSLATTEALKVNIPPDIDDGGDLIQGNHQIHPETGAHCTVPPTPLARLEVVTEIASLTSAGLGTFTKVAEGVQTHQDPAFVYRTTITNSGMAVLTNLVVLEAAGILPEDTSVDYFAPGAMLPPGGSVTRYQTNIWGADTIQTILVAGQSGQGGVEVISSSTAVASVTALDSVLQLSIRRDGSNIILDWPTSLPPGVLLETTTNLNPSASWSVIPNPSNPIVVPGTPAKSTRYYRLRLP